jgi:hypothetical protein
MVREMLRLGHSSCQQAIGGYLLKRLIAFASIMAAFAFSAVPAMAAGHLHALTTGSGDTVSVGPDACSATADDGIYNGFLNFHENVHFGTPGQGDGAFANPSNPVSIARVFCT